MKKLLLLYFVVIIILSAPPVKAQPATIQASGKQLLDVCGDAVMLRGIDYAPYNWGYDTTDYISEIAKTGANCVRLVWYANSSAPEYTLVNLDSALSRCAENKMIPILELHDQTCDNSPAALMMLASWYTLDSVKAILQKHGKYLIVNIANEVLYHNWAGDPSAAVTIYTETYDSIISNLRSAGFNLPLMIDAPDCGTDITLFSTVASSISSADSKHNVIFSAHAYWYAYANNDSLQMLSLISAAAVLNVPVILAEFANLQDDSVPCQYVLNYTALLHICQQYNFSWLCWSWDNDVCAARQMSVNSLSSDLTPYGNDIVNNPVYGLKYTSVLSTYLNNSACIATFVKGIDTTIQTLFCYALQNVLIIKSTVKQQVTVTDIIGRVVYRGTLNPSQQINLPLGAGTYLILSDGQRAVKQAVY